MTPVSRAYAVSRDAIRYTLAPDGYRYGIRFVDGSISERWNGSTQRERVEEEVERMWALYPRDRIYPVRRLPDGDWEPYDSADVAYRADPDRPPGRYR